jgi:hypothetical protein
MPFRVGDLISRSGKTPPRLVDHVLRDVGASGVEASAVSLGRDIAGTARHIERLDARARIDRREHRVDRLARHLADQGIVSPGLLGPAGSLELLERLALLLGDGHGSWTRKMGKGWNEGL